MAGHGRGEQGCEGAPTSALGPAECIVLAPGEVAGDAQASY